MKIEKLVTMANQIGDFYQAYPDKELAAREIAGHLNKFWAESMRNEIATHVRDHAGSGLHAIVIDGIQAHLKTSIASS